MGYHQGPRDMMAGYPERDGGLDDGPRVIRAMPKKGLRKQLTIESAGSTDSMGNRKTESIRMDSAQTSDRIMERRGSNVSVESNEDAEPRGTSAIVNTRGPILWKSKRFQRSFSKDSLEEKKTGPKAERENKKSCDESLKEHGIYVECKRGAKDKRWPNQDSWSVHKSKTHAFYGIYDGHGKQGHDVSNFVKKHLPQLIEQDPRFQASLNKFGTSSLSDVIKDAFKEMEMLLLNTTNDAKKGEADASQSGTTATIVIHNIENSRITVAHIGDSGALLARGAQGNVYLTPDHSPNKPNELKRIEAAGAYVQSNGNDHRMYKKGEDWPALNVSRAFGNLRAKGAGLIAEPDIFEMQLQHTDECLMICSDGVWEFMSSNDASSVCEKAIADNVNPAQCLTAVATKRWKDEAFDVIDDVTAICIDLRYTARRLSHSLRRSGSKDLSVIVFKYWNSDGALAAFEAQVNKLTVESLQAALERMPEEVRSNIHSAAFKDDEDASYAGKANPLPFHITELPTPPSQYSSLYDNQRPQSEQDPKTPQTPSALFSVGSDAQESFPTTLKSAPLNCSRPHANR